MDLVRFFNALSADPKFTDVHIDGYQVPYSDGRGRSRTTGQVDHEPYVDVGGRRQEWVGTFRSNLSS